jgi:phosphoribosylanthranilate isomerase
MVGPKIKICGIKTPDAFDAVVNSGADFVGLNFFPPSPRFVTPDQAAALSARHQGGPKRVGLFVAPSGDDIRAVLAQTGLDVLQIYAASPRCQAIKAEFSLPVWRAVGVSVPADLPTDDEGLDGFVIEAKAPPGATRPGGNAAAFDVSVLVGWTAPGFWLLAGGLTPDNVAAMIAATNAPGVDVSSGVETATGVKSPALIRQFVATARSAAPPAG